MINKYQKIDMELESLTESCLSEIEGFCDGYEINLAYSPAWALIEQSISEAIYKAYDVAIQYGQKEVH